MTARRVGCIGAGNIAETHAVVLQSMAGLELAAAVDLNPKILASFAKRWGIPRTYSTVDALIADRAIDVAHVLVPPPQHKPIAEKLLSAGIHVLLEKPMAQNVAECDALQKAAADSGASLRINHNFIHHPSHLTAKRLIAENRIGPVRHVECRYHLPLRQLGAGQLGHWMFDCPLNLLLEQAVHPLSQIDDLVGPVRDMTVLVAPPLRMGEGREVWRRWLISFTCERGTAQLYLSLGETHPSWGATILGDDGVIFVDYARTRIAHETSGRYGDFFDDFRNGSGMAASLVGQSFGNVANYIASVLKLWPRSDSFFRAMHSSIAAFYKDLENSHGDLNGSDGRRMVDLCERMTHLANPKIPSATKIPAPEERPYDVLVIGGTGFIGAQVVARLTKQGKCVGVLARTTNNLPALFSNPSVQLVRGDARKAEDVTRAIGAAKTVVNLAHGGGGGSRAETEASLVGAAKTVAECCLARGVRRLIFVSSISALYLGNPSEVVIGATSSDAEPDKRADYARAKILAERQMLEMFQTRGLAVAILRPGVVIGRDGPPFHSGIGFYNHETHCLGWNTGCNALPLVLVEDVANAIVNSIDASGIEGKCYNLVGDVRLNAREYIEELARVTDRPLRYHPQSILKLYGIELVKSAVKKVTGRRDPWPSLRDLKSRGLPAAFDCSDACRDLGWTPVRDRRQFLSRGFPIHGEG